MQMGFLLLSVFACVLYGQLVSSHGRFIWDEKREDFRGDQRRKMNKRLIGSVAGAGKYLSFFLPIF